METKREWTTIKEYEEILFDFYNGIARITINRERYRNAFTPTTTTEMSDAFYICRERPDINVVVLTGAGDTVSLSAADTYCTWFVTLRSLPRTLSSDRQALVWVASTPGSALLTSPVWSDKKRPVRSGSYAASTMHRRLWIWVW